MPDTSDAASPATFTFAVDPSGYQPGIAGLYVGSVTSQAANIQQYQPAFAYSFPPSLSQSTGTAAAALNTIWTSWNTTYAAGTLRTWQQPFEEQASELAAAERARIRERQEAAYDAARRARARAEELLLSLLSEEQTRTWVEHGWFEVRGSRGRRWRIRNEGQAGNVDLMPETGDEREATYCAHPPDGLPNADAYIAQMLHLVTDEDGFRATANLQYRRRHLPRPEVAAEAPADAGRYQAAINELDRLHIAALATV